MKAIAAIFDVVPGWLYAILLALALAGGTGEALLKRHYKDAAAAAQDSLIELEGAVQSQKAAAAEQLRAVQASVLAQQKIIDAAAAAQEKTDATHQATSQQAGDALHTALAQHGDRLCSPAPKAGRGGGGSGAPGQASAAVQAGPADGAEAVGVLQPDARAVLEQLMRDADHINDAYISCRAPAMAASAAPQ